MSMRDEIALRFAVALVQLAEDVSEVTAAKVPAIAYLAADAFLAERAAEMRLLSPEERKSLAAKLRFLRKHTRIAVERIHDKLADIILEALKP